MFLYSRKKQSFSSFQLRCKAGREKNNVKEAREIIFKRIKKEVDIIRSLKNKVQSNEHD